MAFSSLCSVSLSFPGCGVLTFRLRLLAALSPPPSQPPPRPVGVVAHVAWGNSPESASQKFGAFFLNYCSKPFSLQSVSLLFFPINVN